MSIKIRLIERFSRESIVLKKLLNNYHITFTSQQITFEFYFVNEFDGKCRKANKAQMLTLITV